MQRYAVYFAPEPGPWAEAAACWLGWDPVRGCAVDQPAGVPDLPRLTADPRKYGFHGTIKAPFRLAEGADLPGLTAALDRLASDMTDVNLPGLTLRRIERFLALVPEGDTPALADLAARVVTDLDAFRAPLTPADIARRRPDQLTARQRDLLQRYGYPYVMEEFRFHLTLSGALTTSQAQALQPHAAAHFDGYLPRPFRLAALCLFGEAEDGRFHLLHRSKLAP